MGESKAQQNDEATQESVKASLDANAADQPVESDRDKAVREANEAAIEEGKEAVEAYNAEAEAADEEAKAKAEAETPKE